MMRAIAAMARVELVLTLRRGESVLVAVGIPVGLLLFFSTVDVLPHEDVEPVDFLVPGIAALAVISSAMTSLSIATAFERQDGVLRRLATTPLGHRGALTAKLVALGAVVVLQLAAVASVGLALGWRPAGDAIVIASILAMGVTAFAGIGLWLAGRLRAEATLAAANGLFLIFLVLGGIVVSVDALPDAMAAIAQLLPAEPFATAVRSAVDGAPVPARAVGTLAVWTVIAPLGAARAFRAR